MEQTILQLLREFGFPVFVVIWFMFRTEKILNANSNALIQLSNSIENLQLKTTNKRFK